MARRSLLPVFFLIGLCTAWIEERPVLETRDGNLVIASAKDRNITLLTFGKSTVNINDINLVEVSISAQEASRIVEKWENGYLRSLTSDLNRIINIVEGPNGLQRRLNILEFGGDTSTNSTAGPVRPGSASQASSTEQIMRSVLNQLSSRIRNVERNIRTIRSKLRVDECATGPCKNGGTCIRSYDGFQCICPANWEGSSCTEDVNECGNFAGTDLGCQNGATCTNLPGSYRCSCAAGWHGIHCNTKSSVCDTQNSRELCSHGTCIPKAGTILGYTCICEQGWESEGTDPACTKDVDECSGKHPACSMNPPVPCVNLPGTYHCGMCPRGYTGNGHYCTDIDECAVDNGGCSSIPRVQCINTIGSWTCGPCPAGYQGNGMSCTYVGICRINNGGCHPLATCVENSGFTNLYPQCNCPAGYHGHGMGPQGCVLGTDNLSPCSNDPCVHGTCHPNGAHFTCRCNQGFTGTLCDTQVNPCTPNPCMNEGICRSSDSRQVTCECTSKFMGPRCETQRQACGGLFRNPSGTLEYPPSGGSYAHDLNCAFVILTNVSRVLNITFTRFDFEKSHNCRFDFLQIHDGANAGAHQMGRFCGTDMPLGGSFETTHNAVYLWLRSDSSGAHRGFALRWNSIEPTCGELLTADHGTISSPGSPGKYPNNRDCTWTIIVRPGKRIQFHFFTVMMEEHPTCDYDYLEINETTSNRDVQLGLYCNHTHPAPLTTSGSYAQIHFHSDAAGSDMGFQISYSTIEGVPGCGGVFTADHGIITTPGYPTNYPPRMICDWKIQLPRSERIRLTWMSFDLENNRACRFDSVQVFSGSDPTAPVAGRYCGKNLPASMTIDSNEALIIFTSDWSNERQGFQLKYETICGGLFHEPSGQIQSPYYPNNYPASRTCIYEIIQPPGKGIILNIVDLEIESGFGESCYFDGLLIYDGDNENSTLLGQLCGNSESIPSQPYYSTHNFMYLKFVTDSSIHNRGFFANYTTVDRRCGGLFKSPTGVIQSHIDGERYSDNEECIWTLKAPKGHIVQLTFTTFSLEDGINCNNDYVIVYDGSNDSGQQMGRYCGTNKPQPLTTQGESMTLVFRTDSSVSHEGFIAHYIFIDASKVCGGHYYTPTGVITSPNYPERYPANRECVWIITAPNKQQINLEIEEFDIEKVASCSFDYLEIRNGGHETSPLIDKYCGTKIPRNFKSLTNELYLKFVTDSSRQMGGFSLKWDSSTVGCGGTLSGSRGEIISPNYPQPYARLANCVWKIAIASGSKVQLIIVDFDLEDHARCRYDYIEVSSGIENHRGNSKRYCGSNLPPYIDTENNLVTIRFRSDYTNSGRGFHIRYETLCFNTVRGFNGIIESPNFPNKYPPSTNCTWIIEAPVGNKINLTFSHFELEGRASSNSCTFDYLTISEGPYEVADTEITTLCDSGTLPERISSTQNRVFLNFITDRYFNYDGFRLEWFVVGCGGHLTRPNGEFTSPGYPNAYPENIACEWLIEVDYGQSVEISFLDVNTEKVVGCKYDKIMLYGGGDENSPKLGEFCHTDGTIKYTSTTNKMFVKFEADFSFAGRGFKAIYKTVDITCGGQFHAYEGLVHSANYPSNYPNNQNCEWLIQVDKNHVVGLNFTDFDIEDTTNCTDDYVKVFDGISRNDTVLGTFCRNNLPPPILSSGNSMLVVMRSDSLVTAKGFQAKFHKACGARIVTEGSGTIESSSLLHLSEENTNCTWIIVAQDPADHVTITFFHMDMASIYSWNNDCDQHYIRVYEGESTDGPTLGQWCGTKVPPPLISTGNALTVHLYSNYGGTDDTFGATYSVLNTACGGEYLSASGTLASPSYPESYPINAECIWLLKTSPGNRISVTFSVFELETSQNCDRDYLEIREDSGIGKLVGIYCNEAPETVTSSTKLWIKFRSDDTGTAKGFLAEFNFLHGNELTGISGEIASPLYPHPWKQDEMITWRITVEFGMVIRVEFDDVHIENFGDYCSSKVSIYDGYNDEAVEIASVCGLAPPQEPTISSSNVLYLKFVGDFYREGNWFHLHWYQIPRVTTTDNTVEKISDCVIEYDLTSKDNRTMRFNSPGWPDGYADTLDCTWIFTSPPGHHLNIHFMEIDLEESLKCINDYVAIYDGNGLTSNLDDLQLLSKVCHANDTSKVTVGKSVMTVKFQTDYYINKTGFRAIVWRDCGGELFGSNGVIDFNDTVNMYDRVWNFGCEWNITVKPGKTIEVSFENFNVLSDDAAGCKENFVLLKNGAGPESPLLGDGKYCRNEIPGKLETTSNRLYVKAVGVKSQLNFKITYREVSMACGGSFRLGETAVKQTQFNSPNYPNIPPPFSECFWTFLAPAGERLSLHFIERFDLDSSANCTREYVEVRDGGTEHSKLLGKFCRETAPSSMTTTGNMLYVHFYTDLPNPNNGFKAAVTSGDVCGGILRGKTGVIKSPNYPSTYPIDQVCGWWIVGPPDHTLKLEFRDLHLPILRRCESTDYVSISERLPINETVNSFGNWCGTRKPDIPETSSNEAIVSFHSDNRTAGNYRGFSLNYTASKDTCGGSLSGVSGEFKSTGYPNPNTRSRYCEWSITVPEGSQVVVEILGLDITETEEGGQFEFYLAFYNDKRSMSKIEVLRKPPYPQFIRSTSNYMKISYWFSAGHRGLKARFSTAAPAPCGGPLDSEKGSLLPPPKPYNETSYFCQWKLRAPETMIDPQNRTGTTLTVTISGSIGDYGSRSTACTYRLKYIRVNDGEHDVRTVCGNITGENYIVRSPAFVNTIDIMNGTTRGGMDFHLNYQWNPCGGVLTGPSHTIRAPGNVNYPKSCVWHAKFDDPGSAMNLSFSRMNMGSCDKGYIIVRNGGPLSPQLGKFCGNIKPHDITSSANQLWIEYWATQAPGDFEFQLNLVSGSCGGVFRGSSKEISSPGFPKQYPNNVECIWEITAEPGHTVGLFFVDRFNLETSPSCSNDFVQTLDWQYDEKGIGVWRDGPKFCGRNTPSTLNSTTNRLKVMFRSNDRTQGDGFRAMWEQNCGGVFEATSREQFIESPLYPDVYPRNQFCNYTIIGPKDKEIWLEFVDFELEGRRGDCKYDNMTITRQHYYATIDVWCGDRVPPNVNSNGVINIVFKSDAYVQRRGFQFKYFLNQCGGEITEPTQISPPSTKHGHYFGRLNCTWVIRAPEGKSVVLRFEKFHLEISHGCIFDQVLVVEGDNLARGSNLAKLCGNVTNLFPVKSVGNAMTVMFRSDGSNEYGGMQASIIFANSVSSGCGGKVNLSKSETFKTQKTALYDSLEDCHWRILTEPGKNVKFTISHMDLKNSTNSTRGNEDGSCSGDYLEVRDGSGPFNQLIGQYCGNVAPQPITSTMDALWIRLFTDGTVEGEGVTGTLEPIPSPCGKSLWEINDTVVFESPNYPADFPAGIQCRWIFQTSAMWTQLRVHFEDLNMEDAPNCEGDHLQISDEEHTYISQDFGEDFVYNGRSNRPRYYGGRFNSDLTFKYCGQAKPSDHYSSSNEIHVSLKTTTERMPKTRKFKFDVSTALCNRNYTAEQGRILHQDITECWTTITTAPNRTISLYFNFFHFYDTDNCEKNYVQVHDGDFSSPIIQTLCGTSEPSPIFSTGNKISLHAKSGRAISYGVESYDIIYTTTDKGRGCGGNIYNYAGIFTSPFYPSNYRNDSICEWEISVPRGYQVALQFVFFDLGPSETCGTDYLQVVEEYTSDERSELYCPGQIPATFRASGNVVKVTYASSVNNGGTGWMIRFTAVQGTDMIETSPVQSPYQRRHPWVMYDRLP